MPSRTAPSASANSNPENPRHSNVILDMTRKVPCQDFSASTGGPVWSRALDWLLRIEAAPRDRRLLAQRDAWLAEHASHATAYRQAERVWRLTGAVPPTARWLARRRRGGLALVAAALAVGLMLSLATNSLLRADYRTGAGETRDVALPDGSSVSLDADSAIALGSDRAVELLSGRAFFQVKRDPADAFTVTAGEARITVLGTAFDVLLTEGSVTIAVQAGSVSVASGPLQSVTLNSGQRAIVDRADGAVTAATVGTTGIAAWRSGKLVVEGVPVAEVVEELDRHHSGVILLRDPALGARRITGVFDLQDPEAALRAVLRPYGGQILAITPYLLVVQGS
jgi:transmembrane sensor